MKREISWRFDLTVDYEPRSWRALLVVAFLLACVGDLASENISLTTYYPAPSGVYAQMITTGNTYLARDVGKVGIGTIAPNASLDVNQTSGANSGMLHVAGNSAPSPSSQGAWIGWNALNGGTGETDFINNRGGGSGGFAFFNTPNAGTPRTQLLTISGAGAANLSGNLTVGGVLYPGCSWVAFGNTGTTYCPDVNARAVAFDYTGGFFQPQLLNQNPNVGTYVGMWFNTTGNMLCCRIHE